jgi:hypothetical protein
VAQEASASAYVPLSFDAGEAYQFDWSHEIVILDGVTVTVKVAHVRLCHSRMPFVRAYPRETQEMVFDAHDRAFAFFGGACARGIYDNMKTAVDTIFVGKDRAYNRRFQQMCGHYLVDPVACTPASGWEKGQVENQVGVLRRRFFVPRPKFKSFAELNAWLGDRCIAYAKANRHPDIPDKTIWEVFEEERSSLVPYVGPFDGFHAVPASVSVLTTNDLRHHGRLARIWLPSGEEYRKGVRHHTRQFGSAVTHPRASPPLKFAWLRHQ